MTTTNTENQEIQENNDDLYERFSFKTDKGQEPLRIDKYLMNRIEGATRNKLQQAINAGLCDEIHIGIMPVLLGNGLRFFDNLEVTPTLEKFKIFESDARTDIWYHVIK